jgi:hypothetical protein
MDCCRTRTTPTSSRPARWVAGAVLSAGGSVATGMSSCLFASHTAFRRCCGPGLGTAPATCRVFRLDLLRFAGCPSRKFPQSKRRFYDRPDGPLDREFFDRLLEAPVVIEPWKCEYNQNRPHSSSGHQTLEELTARCLAAAGASPLPASRKPKIITR